MVKGDSGVPSSDDTPPSPPNDVTGVLELDEVLDEVTQCAGVSFDFDSCIVSSTLLAVADPNGPLGNLTALILGCPEESCDPPPEDLSGILNSALNDAIVSCGEETSAEEIENVTKSLDQLLTADDCFDIHVGDHIDTITGSVEGDLTLAYVAQCADVEVSAESCIFQKTMGMIFSSSDDDSEHSRHLSNVVRILEGQEGDDDGVCEAPNMDPQVTDFLVYQAGVQCQNEGHEVTFADTAEATVTLNQLFGSESEECWLNLCSGDAELALISSWLDFCADIQMPFPLPPEEDMMFNPEYYEPQVKLSCMVQFAMTSEWATFGEPSPPPGSPDECLPPGHDKMEAFCPSTIAPIALEYCKNVTLLDALPPATPTMSYSSDDMSMSYSFSYHYSTPSASPSVYENKDQVYIDNLCELMEDLSSESGKSCLVTMCELDNDDDYDDDHDDDDHDDDDHDDDDDVKYKLSLSPSSPPQPVLSPTSAPSPTLRSPGQIPSIAPSSPGYATTPKTFVLLTILVVASLI